MSNPRIKGRQINDEDGFYAKKEKEKNKTERKARKPKPSGKDINYKGNTADVNYLAISGVAPTCGQRKEQGGHFSPSL